jgi:SAM-dependent methyltransferase
MATNSLRTLLHRLVSTGWGYDLAQVALGTWFTRPRWRAYLSDCHGLVLDIGGGTGNVERLLPAACYCICLDNDIAKLRGFGGRGRGAALLADARRIPLPSGSVDCLTCLAVTHHLTDEELSAAFRESARVLKPDGIFLLADALWKPARLPSRILWALDRGANPRSLADLERALEAHFRIRRHKRFAFYHEYAAFTCTHT